MFSQGLLREELARRINAARIGLEPPTTAGSAEAHDAAHVSAVVVVRDIDVAAFVTGALAHTVALPAAARDAWYRSFTRTIFLAGNPERLQHRHPPDHCTPDGAIGWYAAAELSTYLGLRRLLRAFDGPRIATDIPATVPLRLPGRGAAPRRARRLLVDVAGLGMGQYLVHLHHTVCEAAICGLIGPGDALEVVHVQEIDESVGRWDYARVHADHRDERRLRLYTCLSSPIAVSPSKAHDRKEAYARGR